MQMDTEHIVLSRMMSKTGQVVSRHSYDDGAAQIGWWKGRTVETNRQRFVAKTIAGDDVVIDRATGLIWAADGNGIGCNTGSEETMQIQLAYALGLSFAGFGDWRLPNIKELASIVDFGRYNPAIDPLFLNTQTDRPFWSSTTYHNVPTSAFYVDFASGWTYFVTKAQPHYMRAVRTL